jgi:hypothetical protein
MCGFSFEQYQVATLNTLCCAPWLSTDASHFSLYRYC